MGDKQVVVAIFPDEAAADTAAQSLKDWDKLDDDVKLNAIGILVLDENGKIKTQKMGRRSWGKGAGIGVVSRPLRRPGCLPEPSPAVCSEGSTTRDSGSTVPSVSRLPMPCRTARLRSGLWSRRPRRRQSPTSSPSSAANSTY